MRVPSLIDVVLHPERNKPSPEPLPVSLRPLVRFGIAQVVVWVGLSLVTSLVRGTSPRPPDPPSDDETVPHSLAGVDGPVPVRPAEVEPPA